MNVDFRSYQPQDLDHLLEIWNDILLEGNAFPGDELYQPQDFAQFLQAQSAVTCITVDDKVAGYYILHPNNIGWCSHVANASYAIAKAYRRHGLGAQLVKKSLEQAGELGFKGMQFNAVVTVNKAAIHLYQKLGFQIVGTIPGGYRLKDGAYSDMHVMYYGIG